MTDIKTRPITFALYEIDEELAEMAEEHPELTFELARRGVKDEAGVRPSDVVVSGPETEVMIFLMHDCGIYDDEELWEQIDDGTPRPDSDLPVEEAIITGKFELRGPDRDEA